jgi:hypothetical protein
MQDEWRKLTGKWHSEEIGFRVRNLHPMFQPLFVRRFVLPLAGPLLVLGGATWHGIREAFSAGVELTGELVFVIRESWKRGE